MQLLQKLSVVNNLVNNYNHLMKIKRDKYLNELKLRMNNGLVKIITGLRRCGKSYLLNEIFYEYLLSTTTDKSHIITISLEDFDNRELKIPENLNKFIKSKIIDETMHYLIIDEIQEVPDFISLLNSWMKINNLDIYVTGSNSKFLSSDIITQFRGRGDNIELYPLSFKEYFENTEQNFDEALDSYMTYGGMPFLFNRPTETMKSDYLKHLFNEIYIKDIKERYKIKHESELDELLNIISSNVGSLTNSSRLENTFKSVKGVKISKNTIDSYLEILEDSFLIKRTQRYDIKGKKYINASNKFYFTDLGLRNSRLNFRQSEYTHLMENLIFNELSIKGYNIDVGVIEFNEKNSNGNYVRKQIEIDFIANMHSSKLYIQSAFSLNDDEKFKQETRPLINTGDSFKKFMITRDYTSPKKDDRGINIICLKDFLLNDDILNA